MVFDFFEMVFILIIEEFSSFYRGDLLLVSILWAKEKMVPCLHFSPKV